MLLRTKGTPASAAIGKPDAPNPAQGPVRSRKRRIAFWTGRFLLVAVATTLIVLGLAWWRDRPLAQAEAALAAGDARYAQFVLEKFLGDHPSHQRATALQARVHVALGNAEEALALFDQVGGASAEELHAWAHALLLTEQWSLAVPLLERVVQMTPDDPDAWYELTASRTRLGMFDKALESAQRFARMPGQEARGHVFIGAILRDLGQDAEAAAAYRTVLQHDPTAESLQLTASEFFLQYGQTLLKLGKPEEALDPLKRSAAILESPDVLFELGNAALQLQRVEDAKTAWQRAVKLDERRTDVREALARAALSQQQPQQALEWLAPLSEKDATLESAFLRQRIYQALGNEKEAARWQETAAQLRKKQEFDAEIGNLVLEAPESFWARVVRTHRFAEQGNWRQAELMVEMLLREAPADPFVIELSSAVHRRRDLPSLESLPITHY